MGEDEEVLESVPGRWVREVDEAIARDKEETKKLQSQSAVQETVRVLDTQGDKTWFGPPLSPRHAAVGGTELLKLRGTTRMSDDGTPRIGEDDDPTWVRPPEVEAGKIVVQVDGKRVCELYGTRDLNDFEIKRRAMCEVDVEKEIHGRPVKDMVYLPNRALNIVTGRPWMQADRLTWDTEPVCPTASTTRTPLRYTTFGRRSRSSRLSRPAACWRKRTPRAA